MWPFKKRERKKTLAEMSAEEILQEAARVVDEVNRVAPYLPKPYRLWFDTSARPYILNIEKWEPSSSRVYPRPVDESVIHEQRQDKTRGPARRKAAAR